MVLESSIDLPAVFRMALDNIREGVFFVDKRGFLVFANAPAAIILTEEGRLIEGSPFFGQCRPRAGESLHAAFHELMDEPTAEVRQVQGKSGDFYFEAACRPVIGEAEQPLGLLGIVFDISERRRYTKIVRQMASIDSLTRLYNRRHFYMKLREESLRARRQGYPLSLIILDLDEFKRINDEQGHLKGDSILRTVGEAIAVGVRGGVDIPCRFGGDEFVVILPEANLHQAADVARRIRTEIYERTEPNLTTSAGVAELGERGPDSLLHVADRALLRAKSLGGDLVLMEHEKSRG